MYKKLEFKKNGTTIAFEPHELWYLVDEHFNKLMKQNEPSLNHPLVPTYHSIPEKLKKKNNARRGEDYAAYAKHYGISIIEMSNLIDYLQDPIEYANLHGTDKIVQASINGIRAKIATQVLPAQPLTDYSGNLDLLFPAHIGGMKGFNDWFTLSLYFRKLHLSVSVNGWWLVVSDRLISLRNKNNKDKDDKFLYANDHGTVYQFITGLIQFCHHFTYKEESIHLIQMIVKTWKSLQSPVKEIYDEILRNMFIITFFHQKPFTPYELGNILLESFQDAFALLRHPGHDPKKSKEELQEIIDQMSLKTDVLEQADQAFLTILEYFYFAEQLTDEYYRTRYKISGGRTLLYETLAKFMNKQDADAHILFDMLNDINLDINNGKLPPVYRPVDSYGDKYKGDTYTAFAQSIINLQIKKPEITDVKIASMMRSIIKGEGMAEVSIDFLPNLTTVMYTSETSRIPRLISINTMMLDLIENRCLDSRTKAPMKWANALASNRRIINNVVLTHGESEKMGLTSINYYGDEVSLVDFDGFYPQAHHDSAKDKSNLKDVGMSSTRQKEASIISSWLMMMLKEPLSKIGIEMTERLATPDEINRECKNNRIKEFSEPEKSSSSGSSSNKLSGRQIVQEFILPVLTRRMESFDHPREWNMVNAPDQSLGSSLKMK